MKLSKVTKTAVAFAVGASLFVTTAFADMLLGTGYDKFKQAIKTTAQYADEEFDSYSLLTNVDVKFNDELILNHYSSSKIDYLNKQRHDQDVTTNFINNTQSSSYERYNDAEVYLYRNNSDSFSGYKNAIIDPDYDPGDDFSEAFNNEYADEFERIIDAAVGNLKNLVQYDTSSEGTYQFNGELTASQVPALYNAILSLILKDSLQHELGEGYINGETKDVYVSKVTGAATQHEDGYLTDLEASIELTFKNEDNKENTLQFSGKAEFVDINNTKIERPEYDESTLSEVYDNSKNVGLPEKYEGVYKNNIVIDNGHEFVKIGERILTITDITNGQISGSYEEVITSNGSENNEGYHSFKYDFISTTHDYHPNLVEYKDVNTGEIGFATINENYNDSIYFDYGMTLEKHGLNYNEHSSTYKHNYNGQLTKVFE